MTCANCAQTVEKALQKDEKVKFATVNLVTNTAFIIGNDVELDKIRKIVEKVKYGISDKSFEIIEEKRYKKL